MRDENALVLAESRVTEVLDKYLQTPSEGLESQPLSLRQG